MSWRDYADPGNVGSVAYGGINYNPTPLTPSYDNFGSAPVGSSFIVYRAICNNWEQISTSATAENIQFTLHSGVHGETVGPDTNWRERDGTDPEGNIPQSGAYSGTANDSSGVPPTVTDPENQNAENQWALGGSSRSYPATPSGAGRAIDPDRLWTSVRVTASVFPGNPTPTAITGETKTKIGFVSSQSPGPGSYQFYTPVNTGAQSIPDQSGLVLEIDTVIDPQYAGPGNLYARFHVKYTWV